jgi:LCP family protein required for cell wall assembly
MTDNTVPTQSHNDPVKPTESDHTLRVEPHPAPSSGHWYSYPGQQPLSRPQIEPLGTERGRRSTARDRVRRRKVRRELGAPDDWAWVIIAAALLGMTVVMSMSVFFLLKAAQGSNETVATSAPPLEPTSVLYGPGGILEGTTDAAAGGLLGNGESMIIRPWDGEERFTILVVGMDKRPGEMGATFRSDTMILISLDPATKHIGILSIPRDLFVDVPGYGLQRVNTAYGAGELEGEGGGPRLTMQTVQYNFGIRINEYFVVDFNTFIRMIDLIDGIDVNVPTDIYDPEYPDMNYGYDPFYIKAGWNHLDGATALKYARSRHSSDDIDRMRRQQQVIDAVREKVIAFDMIPQLAAQSVTLWAEFQDGVDTGLSLEQILELAWYVKDIPGENITKGVLDWQYVTPVRWEGQDILVPNREKIGSLMLDVFGPGYNQ